MYMKETGVCIQWNNYKDYKCSTLLAHVGKSDIMIRLHIRKILFSCNENFISRFSYVVNKETKKLLSVFNTRHAVIQ